MNKEPLIPQSVEHWTLDQLLARSMEEWKKSLGLPSNIVEADNPTAGQRIIASAKEALAKADKPEQVTDTSKAIGDAKGEDNA